MYRFVVILLVYGGREGDGRTGRECERLPRVSGGGETKYFRRFFQTNGGVPAAAAAAAG